MNINRKFLLAALTKAKAIATYKGNPAMLDARIGNGFISADHPYLSWRIACPAAEGDVFGVDVARAYAFVKGSACDEVRIEDEGASIQFACGGKSAVFERSRFARKQPTITEPYQTSIAGDLLADIFKRVTPAVSESMYGDEGMGCLQIVNEGGVKFKGMSTRNYIEYTIEDKGLSELLGERYFLIDRTAAAMLAKILPKDTVDLAANDSRLFIQSADGSETISANLEKYVYPDTAVFMEKVMGKLNNGEYSRLAFDRKSLITLLKNLRKGKDNAIFCAVEGGSAVFNNPDLKMTDTLALLAPAPDGFKFGFSCSEIARLLQSFSSREVILHVNSDNAVPCLVTGVDDPAMKMVFMQVRRGK